jgi:hypothetical protein
LIPSNKNSYGVLKYHTKMAAIAVDTLPFLNRKCPFVS